MLRLPLRVPEDRPGHRRRAGPAAESAFATILVPGVVGISILFQGVQSVALTMSQEFGFTREIEDRVQAPCPIWLVAMAKVLSGAVQGLISAVIVLPIASVVHAKGVEAHLNLHWWIIVTLVPLACVTMASLGLLLGTSFEPRNIGLMFGFIILPVTFLGGTYYEWTRLAPVEVGGWHWLQTAGADQPADLRQRGDAGGLHQRPPHALYVIYPVLVGFLAAVPRDRPAELPTARAVLSGPADRARAGPDRWAGGPGRGIPARQPADRGGRSAWPPSGVALRPVRPSGMLDDLGIGSGLALLGGGGGWTGRGHLACPSGSVPTGSGRGHRHRHLAGLATRGRRHRPFGVAWSHDVGDGPAAAGAVRPGPCPAGAGPRARPGRRRLDAMVGAAAPRAAGSSSRTPTRRSSR